MVVGFARQGEFGRGFLGNIQVIHRMVAVGEDSWIAGVDTLHGAVGG